MNKGGAGWGGPAKGPGKGSPKAPPFPKGNPGRQPASEKRIATHERLAKHYDNLDQIATDISQPGAARVAASVHVIEFLQGKAVQRQETTGKNGGPQVITYQWADAKDG